MESFITRRIAELRGSYIRHVNVQEGNALCLQVLQAPPCLPRHARRQARHPLIKTYMYTIHRRRLVPNEPCSLAALRQLGVLSWRMDADKHETDPKLAAVRKARNYSYMVRRRKPRCDCNWLPGHPTLCLLVAASQRSVCLHV